LPGDLLTFLAVPQVSVQFGNLARRERTRARQGHEFPEFRMVFAVLVIS
jgi:hypothetical protein